MQSVNELIPHLFRTEYSKIVAVLCRVFGFEHIEIAEDIASDTFLAAAETWGMKGAPDNPPAWLHTVARNRAKDYLRRNATFARKISPVLTKDNEPVAGPEIDLSEQNITDSQLQMMFAVCHPAIPAEAQIGLSLRILCGFGIEEIADAFLSNKETINKRLFRAKEKLRKEKVKLEFPPPGEIDKRLETVLTTLYLLFNEGYYSLSQHSALRKDLCLEAMRLNFLLAENERTARPSVMALLALMCFHASRFDARITADGALVLYDDQDTTRWDGELIARGDYYLELAAAGDQVSKYHLEAAIARWHTRKADTPEKWESILQLYNRLLAVSYSPAAALNRVYALAKAHGKAAAIPEAENLQLRNNHLYFLLMGHLYTGVNDEQALTHLKSALSKAKSPADKANIKKRIGELRAG